MDRKRRRAHRNPQRDGRFTKRVYSTFEPRNDNPPFDRYMEAEPSGRSIIMAAKKDSRSPTMVTSTIGQRLRYDASFRVAFQVAAILTTVCLPACGISEAWRRLSLVQSAVAHAAGTSLGSVSVNLTSGRYLAIA